jgi:uncharacterized membrane protein
VRRASALTRLVVCFAAGSLVFALTVAFVPWHVAALLGWDAAALTFLGWIWLTVFRMDHAATAEMASAEDDSRVAADVILILATLASLVGVVVTFAEAPQERGAARVLTAALAVMSLLLSWASIHTVYTLRYAHLYVRDGGGLDFNGDRAPAYRDFAYVAFTIGMTYQVSDTNIRSKAIRMTALRHAFLSFVFGTGVIATTVSLVADLYRR